MPRSGVSGFLRSGLVLVQTGLEFLNQEIDQLQDIYDKPVFLFETIQPQTSNRLHETTTERYINLMPIESDFYGAYRFMIGNWQSFDSLTACRHAFKKQIRVKSSLWTKKKSQDFDGYNKELSQDDIGYQLIGTFSKYKGHQISMRPLLYPVADHFLIKMMDSFASKKLHVNTKQLAFKA
ncbi:MAG: hypothetical protein CMP22_00515 [Rickettsiales bacterium]|nr:hypothetical protein [Rickettsiales bacterium]